MKLQQQVEMNRVSDEGAQSTGLKGKGNIPLVYKVPGSKLEV